MFCKAIPDRTGGISSEAEGKLQNSIRLENNYTSYPSSFLPQVLKMLCNASGEIKKSNNDEREGQTRNTVFGGDTKTFTITHHSSFPLPPTKDAV